MQISLGADHDGRHEAIAVLRIGPPGPGREEILATVDVIEFDRVIR